MKKINLILIYLFVFTLTACGSGGGGSSNTTPVPTPTPTPWNTTTLLPNGATANYNTTPQTLALNQPANSAIIIQSPESQYSTIYTITYSINNVISYNSLTNAATTAQTTGSEPTVTTNPTPCIITGNGSCELAITADASTTGRFEITGNVSTNTGINQTLQPLIVIAAPTPTPTPTSTLQNYLNLLYYSPPALQKSLADNNLEQSQMTMIITNSLLIKNITVNYYSDSACANINASYPMSGSSILHDGYYTTTSNSNLLLCSNYTSSFGNGCVYLYNNTRSLRYTITTDNNTIIQSYCMTNQKWFGERIGYYNISENWSRNCVNNFNCGYSQPYIFNVN